MPDPVKHVGFCGSGQQGCVITVREGLQAAEVSLIESRFQGGRVQRACGIDDGKRLRRLRPLTP